MLGLQGYNLVGGAGFNGLNTPTRIGIGFGRLGKLVFKADAVDSGGGSEIPIAIIVSLSYGPSFCRAFCPPFVKPSQAASIRRGWSSSHSPGRA